MLWFSKRMSWPVFILVSQARRKSISRRGCMPMRRRPCWWRCIWNDRLINRLQLDRHAPTGSVGTSRQPVDWVIFEEWIAPTQCRGNDGSLVWHAASGVPNRLPVPGTTHRHATSIFLERADFDSHQGNHCRLWNLHGTQNGCFLDASRTTNFHDACVTFPISRQAAVNVDWVIKLPGGTLACPNLNVQLSDSRLLTALWYLPVGVLSVRFYWIWFAQIFNIWPNRLNFTRWFFVKQLAERQIERGIDEWNGQNFYFSLEFVSVN